MEEKKSNKPVAALVVGIVSCAMTLFGIYGSIVGLVCGIIGLVIAIKAKKEAPCGMSTAGFVLAIVGTVLCALEFVVCACVIGSLASLGSADSLRSFR